MPITTTHVSENVSNLRTISTTTISQNGTGHDNTIILLGGDVTLITGGSIMETRFIGVRAALTWMGRE